MKKSKWLRPKCSGSIIFKLKIPMKIGNELDGLRVVKVFLQGCSKSWRTLWIWAIQGNEAVLAQPLLAFAMVAIDQVPMHETNLSPSKESNTSRGFAIKSSILSPAREINTSRLRDQIFKSSNLYPAREIHTFSNLQTCLPPGRSTHFQIFKLTHFQIFKSSHFQINQQSLY